MRNSASDCSDHHVSIPPVILPDTKLVVGSTSSSHGLTLVHEGFAASSLSLQPILRQSSCVSSTARILTSRTPPPNVLAVEQVLGAGIIDGRSPWAMEPAKVVSLVREVASAVMPGNPNGKDSFCVLGGK